MPAPLRVLLIGPTALDYRGDPIKQRKIHLPGLTLPMLAAVTPEDVDLRLVSETAEAIPFNEPWDLVGLTGMGSGIVRAWQLADAFRERGATVVIGGIAASLAKADWTLEHTDALVTGEAEETWPRVIEDYKAGRLQKIYRMERVPDIGTLPLPRYDLMNPKILGRWRPVQATRGCPFPCSFCSIQVFFNRKYRKRPVDQVIRDVRAAKQSGSRYIAFIDDNIGVDWSYSRELWEALCDENIIWMSQCSIHIADRPDMLELAARSGCRLLSFGIESVNAESLAGVEKHFNHPAHYARAIRTIRSYGIDVSTEMIIGMDGDRLNVFEDTYRFLMDNRISVPRVHILTPIPGTALYDQLEQDGRIISGNFGHFSGGRVVFRPKNFSPDVLQDNYWRLYQKLFRLSAIRKRLRGTPSSLPAYLRLFLAGVNFHYRSHIKKRITPGIV